MPRREDLSILDGALGEPADRRTLAGSVTERLRELILDGVLPPGQPLRPAHLAPRLGVSAMPVREALRMLEAEGLVAFTPRMGAKVAEISAEDVEELYLVRGALEGLAARLAVERSTPENKQLLREALAEMESALAGGDTAAFNRWDREFHRRHYDASGRPGLVAKILDYWDSARRIYALTPRSPSSLGQVYESHRLIVAAVENNDSREAERLTRLHTEQAAERILTSLAVLAHQDRSRRKARARAGSGR